MLKGELDTQVYIYILVHLSYVHVLKYMLIGQMNLYLVSRVDFVLMEGN